MFKPGSLVTILAGVLTGVHGGELVQYTCDFTLEVDNARVRFTDDLLQVETRSRASF